MSSIEASAPPRSNPHGRKRHTVGVICAIVAAILIIVALTVALHWPFSEENVRKSLSDASGSAVQFESFDATYFPHPGCVVEGVTFRQRGSRSVPLLAIQRLTIASSMFGLFTKHISSIRVEGAHLTVPPFGTGSSPTFKGGDLVVDHLSVSAAVLDFQRRSGNEPLSFQVASLEMQNVGGRSAMPFSARLHNPQPPGQVEVNGTLGSWKNSDVAQATIKGSYNFTEADLSALGGVAGLLSSHGAFYGALNAIEVEGKVHVPDFEVKRSSHPVDLSSNFKALVDARNGDVEISNADTTIGRTTIHSTGLIQAPSAGNPKEATLKVSVSNGRIQDLLYLFVRAPKSPMNGPVSLQGEIDVPAGREPFLKKIEMRGDFGVVRGTFNNPLTQFKMNKLSAESRGEGDKNDDPERAVSELSSQVVV